MLQISLANVPKPKTFLIALRLCVASTSPSTRRISNGWGNKFVGCTRLGRYMVKSLTIDYYYY